jgi:hypothetical protein
MTSRLLRVVAVRFVAGAVWENEGRRWRCVRAAPILKWMIGCDAATALTRLQCYRYEWEWIR